MAYAHTHANWHSRRSLLRMAGAEDSYTNQMSLRYTLGRGVSDGNRLNKHTPQFSLGILDRVYSPSNGRCCQSPLARRGRIRNLLGTLRHQSS
jgi:hypothetical protein